MNLIKSINLYLNNQAIAIGFEFLDIHSLTDRGDGLSNKIWHLDKYHISSDGMREVWRQHDTKI